MTPTKVILLACGSFNPITNMHLRMFEIAKDYLHHMGQYMVIGGLISPVHDAYGKKELESSTHRLQMIRLALQNTDWIRLSDWECKQETWSRTRQVLQHHQNQINEILHPSLNNEYDNFDGFLPDNVKSEGDDNVQIKLLCGADLLESFGTPGLWANEDIEAIVGQHGLVVITRSKTNPLEFIYNSDILTKHMSNIVIVTEWIRNEVSSTKIRRALRRSESVKYLLPDKVIEYIYQNALYHSTKPNKYLLTSINNSLTPSPSDVPMESPSPTNCTIICNNTLFSHQKYCDKQLTIDTVDNNNTKKINVTNALHFNNKHPGQAVKIITENNGEHKIIKNYVINNDKPQVRKPLKLSKSLNNFNDLDNSKICKKTTNNQLKECKSCDENLIKFIFTKHGIQVISDVETIV